MKTRIDKGICNWWDGPCLFEILDRIEVPLRDPKGPVRLDSYAYFILHSELHKSLGVFNLYALTKIALDLHTSKKFTRTYALTLSFLYPFALLDGMDCDGG